jgi:ABC-type nitrate/sulfonate/bicarbonate transport system ATPase subunit
MDEPFQSQDPALKIQLIELVKTLQKEENRTIIAVTHDVREAAALADRAIVLNGSPVKIVLDIPISPEFERTLSEVLSCQTSII